MWHHPYKTAKEFKKRTAYFSMEFAIHQGLKTYSRGLGFLAGYYMRSAFVLKQNLIGVGMLWKYGYYDSNKCDEIAFNAIDDIITAFNNKRMAKQYYNELY